MSFGAHASRQRVNFPLAIAALATREALRRFEQGLAVIEWPPRGFHVKHADQDSAILLAQLCEEAGVTVTPDQAEQAVTYLLAIIERNHQINLTRIDTLAAGIRLHLLDSLLALPEFAAAPLGSICDIGTGGGFPGVPLSIVTGRSTTLLDSVRKKTAAVNAVLETLGAEGVDIHARAVGERAEIHAATLGARYAVVTARAVAPLASLVELAAPLLMPDGVFVAYKGAPLPDELAAGDVAARIVGMKRLSLRTIVLPRGDEERTVISYIRSGSGKVSLPRRDGLAQHLPLR